MKNILTLAVLAVSLLGAASSSVHADWTDSEGVRQDPKATCAHEVYYGLLDRVLVMYMVVDIEAMAGHVAHGDSCWDF